MLADDRLAEILDANLKIPSASRAFLNEVDRIRHHSPPAAACQIHLGHIPKRDLRIRSSHASFKPSERNYREKSIYRLGITPVTLVPVRGSGVLRAFLRKCAMFVMGVNCPPKNG